MTCETFQFSTSNQEASRRLLSLEDADAWLDGTLSAAALPLLRSPIPTVSLLLLKAAKSLWTEPTPNNQLRELLLLRLVGLMNFPKDAATFDDVVRFNRHPTAAALRTFAYNVCCNTSGIVWVYSALTRTTVGLIWAFDEEGSIELESILDGLVVHSNFLDHPLLLATLTSAAIINSMQKWVASQSEMVARFQVQTGYHAYANVDGGTDLQTVDLASLSSRVSGLAANIACSVVCLQGLKGLVQHVREQNECLHLAVDPGTDGIVEKRSLFIEQQCVYWLVRVTAMLQESQSWQTRSSIVIQGIFNLIAQRDNEQNLEMQRKSTEIAKASMSIAEESKRDSTTMKAIAAVTTFFLPGTFVASFFAMPMFQWDARLPRSQPGHCGFGTPLVGIYEKFKKCHLLTPLKPRRLSERESICNVANGVS